MKILQVIRTIVVLFALSLALSAVVAAQPPINPAGAGCKARLPFLLAQSDYGGDFDLNYCQWECRMRFGLEPTGSGGIGAHSETQDRSEAYELHQSAANYNQYADCIAGCNRKFWDEFDKNTKETGKKP
jgi:hypothetical protein